MTHFRQPERVETLGSNSLLVRQAISQMLADAGINRQTISEEFKKAIEKKVETKLKNDNGLDETATRLITDTVRRLLKTELNSIIVNAVQNELCEVVVKIVLEGDKKQ